MHERSISIVDLETFLSPEHEKSIGNWAVWVVQRGDSLSSKKYEEKNSHRCTSLEKNVWGELELRNNSDVQWTEIREKLDFFMFARAAQIVEQKIDAGIVYGRMLNE